MPWAQTFQSLHDGANLLSGIHDKFRWDLVLRLQRELFSRNGTLFAFLFHIQSRTR